MKIIILCINFMIALSAFATEKEPKLLAIMPEMATLYAVVDEIVDDKSKTSYAARIYSIEDGLVSEFKDCVPSTSGGDDAVFRCFKENEKISYFKEEFYLFSWENPMQLEMFESDSPTGRFEQMTGYLLQLSRTDSNTFTVAISFDEFFEDVYASCVASWVNDLDRDAEIYCLNGDGTDIIIFGSKQDDKLFLTGMWETPKLVDHQAYFRGEVLIEDVADLIQ